MMLVIFNNQSEADEFESKVYPDAYTVVGQIVTTDHIDYPSYIYQITDPKWQAWWMLQTGSDTGHEVKHI